VRRVSAPLSRVAVVGAGASLLVGHLASSGYRVIAIDIAATALEQLRARLGDEVDVEYVVADVRSVRFAEPVDTWHDRAVFHFLTTTVDQDAYVASAAAAVHHDGHIVLATFALDGPDHCSGLPVARHDAESLRRIFGRSFDLVESFETDHITPSGSSQRFTHAVLRRTIAV